MRELESRLQAENPRYRRIWVQYCAHRQLRALLTLFPCGHQPYEMIMGEVTDLSYESINNLLQTNIVK